MSAHAAKNRSYTSAMRAMIHYMVFGWGATTKITSIVWPYWAAWAQKIGNQLHLSRGRGPAWSPTVQMQSSGVSGSACVWCRKRRNCTETPLLLDLRVGSLNQPKYAGHVVTGIS